MMNQLESSKPDTGHKVVERMLGERINNAQKEEVLDIYQGLMQTVWERIFPILGRVTLIAIMERAVVITKKECPFVRKLRIGPQGPVFDGLHEVAADAEISDIRQAMRELVANVIDILAMLTGDLLVKQLVRDIEGGRGQ